MDEEVYTTFEISKICSVDITTIMAWVDDGKLRAYRTPGGHRRILHRDLIGFLKKYNMPIPSEVQDSVKKILLVEDDSATLRLLTRVINRLDKNFKVETARDGFEAGQKLELLIPDLVVLDLFLPGVDGFRIIKNIRSQKKNDGVKILAISGVDVDSTKSKVLRMGADAFLAKPFEIAHLSETISSFLLGDRVGV